jgi:uncharacterized protein
VTISAPRESSSSRPFWEATRQERLVLPFCPACDACFWYPRPFCPRCLADELDWRAAAGTAVVHALTVMHQPGPGRDRADGPYTVAIVELTEGVRMLTNLVGAAPGEISVGDAVTVTWHEVPDGRKLPMFTPV